MIGSVTPDLLKKLNPMSEGVSPENLQELCNKAELLELPAGKIVFKRAQSDSKHFYLLQGEVQLIDEINRPIKILKSDDENSSDPIEQVQPRRHSCRVTKDAVLLVIDSNLIDIMMTWDRTGTYEINKSEQIEDGQEGWISQILQCKAFKDIPPTNIQALFMCMEPVSFTPGGKVIKEGDDGDYFYVIKSGRALVTRSTPTNPNGLKLAELKAGDSFGEEALISDTKRNATITMLTNGELVRLSKESFISLLNEPTLNWVDLEGAKELKSQGAELIDVRMPAEFKAGHIKGSVNIPLIMLRIKCKNLDPSKKIILICDTGRRSSAASYILAERGFECVLLKDGLNSL